MAGAAFLGAAFGGAAGWQQQQQQLRGVGGNASEEEEREAAAAAVAAGGGGAEGGDAWASLYVGPEGDLGDGAGVDATAGSGVGHAASPAAPHRGIVASSPQSASGLRHAAQSLHV